jgi:hypothetical protein
MQAFYDNQPKKLEAVGNGSFRYRYNIREEEKPVQASENSETAQEAQAQPQWVCEEVTVWAPLSANKITEKVLTERWDGNYEQKLVNEYNSAQMGLLSEEEAAARIEAYRAFLTERTALKSQVDADCAELGIK